MFAVAAVGVARERNIETFFSRGRTVTNTDRYQEYIYTDYCFGALATKITENLTS